MNDNVLLLGEYIRPDENGNGFVFSQIARVALTRLLFSEGERTLGTELRICDPESREAQAALKTLRERKLHGQLRQLQNDGTNDAARIIEIRGRLEARDNQEEVAPEDGTVIVGPHVAEAIIGFAQKVVEHQDQYGDYEISAESVIRASVDEYLALVTPPAPEVE